MTWKEFKDAVEKQGILDADELWCIDFYANIEPQDIVVTKDADVIIIDQGQYRGDV